ncbi:MAG: peptide chain release factor N(5)-glutamine methyltransferase [Patescibacteria group bacterium]|jgi:release factor glutamine methyltransferase
MQIINWQREATQELVNHSITSATLDAEVLLSFVLKKPKEYILSHPEIILTQKQQTTLDKLIKRRTELEPVAYLTNNKEFYGLDFYVDKNVLIPRPETELLVETVLKEIKNDLTITIADIGTGSGCIAIAIAKNLPQAKIIAVDISNPALTVAKKNAKKYGVKKQIRFVCGDLLKKLNDPVDIIIANLPYVPKNEAKKEISFEPKEALFGENDGMEFLEKIITQSKTKLNENGVILLEIHPPQADKISSFARNTFPDADIIILKDLANKERILSIKL